MTDYRGNLGYATRKALATFVSGSNPFVLLLVLVFVIATNLFLVAIEGWVALVPNWPIWSVSGFGVLIIVLFVCAWRWKRDLLPEVHVTSNPQPVRVLILFLSPPAVGSPDDRENQREIVDTLAGSVLDKQIRNRLGASPWRMPVEAIAHHYMRLETVIVMPSTDGVALNTGAAIPNGTYRHMAAFKSLIRRLTDGLDRRPEVLSLAEYLEDDAFEQGLGFEDIKQCVAVLNRLYQSLRRREVRERDILIDITGGQKPNSVAGAAAAITVPGREFQYISTHDKTVQAFDVTQVLED